MKQTQVEQLSSSFDSPYYSAKTFGVDTSHTVRSLLSELITSKLDFQINGSVEKRIPNNLNIAIKGKVAEQLFNFMPHIALSSGSACTSGTIERSHVLSAMKLDDERIDGSFRISTGRNTSKEEIKELVKSLNNE